MSAGRPFPRPVVRQIEATIGRAVLAHTQLGPVPLTLDRASGGAGVVLLGDRGVDAERFAGGLYPRLAAALGERQIAAVRVSYRGQTLDDATFDAQAAIQVLAMGGARRLVIVGHGLGASAAAQVAALLPQVEAIVALGVDGSALAAFGQLGPRGALLIHGTLDLQAPSAFTLAAHAHAVKSGARSELRFLDHADHDFTGATEPLFHIVEPYIAEQLGAGGSALALG